MAKATTSGEFAMVDKRRRAKDERALLN